ncbi:MAG: M23 family metallopeptidase, partial [Fibrobacteres bacterium]|nr:M23 family metallopeptidase [Fibrobacterota bacterium]
IVLNLEIPEASIIRSAQDSGLSVVQLRNTGSLKKAFEQLTDAVQFLLNRIHNVKPHKMNVRYEIHAYMRSLAKAAVFIFAALFSMNTIEGNIPPVRTPAQLEKTEIEPIVHKFANDETLFRVAKHAISEYRALITNNSWLEKYLREIIQNHNFTAKERNQPYIHNTYAIPAGTEIVFYPPSFIRNKNYPLDSKLFAYYKSLIKDDLPYITGLWANRGTGGGTPHEGVDIACPMGTTIISPSDGVAKLDWSPRGGTTVMIYKDDYMLMFCHMDKRFVQHGERVIKGQPIGSVGMTGVTSGPHLHFGYAIKSPRGSSYDFIDPNNWVFRQNFIQKEIDKTE